MGIVGLTEFHRRILVGIGPVTFAGNHLPPYAYVFCRVNPTGILNLTRFVEVQDQMGSQHLAGIVGDEYGAPGTLARCLQIALHALRIRGKP